MGFADWLHNNRTLRQNRGRSSKRRRYDYRLRAVICLLLYTHNFAINSVATDDAVPTQCRASKECVGTSNLPVSSQVGE